MATQAPNASLPMFYNGLQPVSRQLHGDWKVGNFDAAKLLRGTHAVPVTTEEFGVAQRHFPIVFSAGDTPVPLALMGLNEGVNVFFAEGVTPPDGLYIPAYVRRYPFLLARLRPDSDELSLCFDPAAGSVGADVEGQPIFDGEKPSETTNAIMQFCESFEQAGARTTAFVEELKRIDLLMDGEVSIQPQGAEQPFIYRGFKMVDEKKLFDMRGDELRKLNQSGALPLIFAHLFSLPMIRDLFAMQLRTGQGPALPAAAQANAPVPAPAYETVDFQ